MNSGEESPLQHTDTVKKPTQRCRGFANVNLAKGFALFATYTLNDGTLQPTGLWPPHGLKCPFVFIEPPRLAVRHLSETINHPQNMVYFIILTIYQMQKLCLSCSYFENETLRTELVMIRWISIEVTRVTRGLTRCYRTGRTSSGNRELILFSSNFMW